MIAEDRIPLAHWVVAGLAASGVHALLLLFVFSGPPGKLVGLGEPQGRPDASSRIRIALRAPAAPPARPPAVGARPAERLPRTPSLPSPHSSHSPHSSTPLFSTPSPAPSTSRPAASPEPPDAAVAPAESGSPSPPAVGAGPMAAAEVGPGGEPPLGAETGDPLDPARSGYFDALHARVRSALDYPGRARLEGVEGTVVLRVRIDREGRIESARVADSSGSRILDRHAVRVAKRAAPFGPVPRRFGDDDLDFELPVEFSLTD